MRHFYKLLIYCCLIQSASFAQTFNVDSVSHVNYQSLHQANLNDCWGYVDESGIEYALVGTTKGTSIVSLENPQAPVEVFWEPGTQSLWRDLQVYGDYAYITTEAQDGLLIIDMSPLPASTTLPTTYYFGPGNSWQSAHDIFIDTLGGWAYICGANRGNGGMIILDIHTDPMNPIEVGEFDNWYCHDAFAQGNLLYGAHIGDGILSIIDVTDHANPVLINTQPTTNTFTHNVWVTTDDHYAVTTDEVAGAFLTLYDVSDPMNIAETDKIQSSPGENIIPHNAFIVGDSMIASSYYMDGITFHDMSRPNNLVQVGAYDTHPGQSSNFDGSWGVYPFLPSGLVLASDMSQGLFVVRPELPNASYFEGLVRDASTLNPLNNVSITMLGDPQTDVTGLDGRFAVGKAGSATVQVAFFKVAYEPDTITLNFVEGELIVDTIDLVPLQPITVNVHVQESGTGTAIIDADIRVQSTYLYLDYATDGFGDAQMQVYYPGMNQLSVGKWGYITKCMDTNLVQNNMTVTVELEKGYYDDFTFDNNWNTTYGTATSGLWERCIPYYNGTNSTPQGDAAFDCGGWCFVTGNTASIDSDLDDVDGGPVVLRSPVFDVTTMTDPYVSYQRYFFNWHGPALFDDELTVKLTNGLTTVAVDLSGDSIYYAQWETKVIRIQDYLTPTANMRLIISTSDMDGNVNITDAAFDYFMVTEGSVASVDEQKIATLLVVPNPSEGHVSIHGLKAGDQLEILTLLGEHILSKTVESTIQELDLTRLSSGIYLVRSGNQLKRIEIK